MSIDTMRIFGDWGTSHLRLLLGRGDHVLDQLEGPGIGALPAAPGGVDFAAMLATRSRQLVDGLARPAAVAALSGLIIGQDVAGCLPLFGAALSQSRTVHLIGAPHLLELYALAFSGHGVTARPMDATRATMIGLRELAEHVHAA